MQDISDVLITCLVSSYDVQVELTSDISPYLYWAFALRDSWLDIPWGIHCIFLSPNSHLSIGYMKQKATLVRLKKMIQVLKFKPSRPKHHAKRNHWCRSDNMKRLSTLFDCSSSDSNGSSLFLLTYVYLVTIVFSYLDWLRMALVWPSGEVPCLHSATLNVLFRILALWQCWFVCVFSQAG